MLPSLLEERLSPAERKLTINLALAARSLSREGHDDFNQGQVSARMPRGERFFIKRAVCGFNEACPEDAVEAFVDPERPVSPQAPPELPLHQALYAARPDVNAIVHSHAPHTLVFGATDLELQPLSHEGAFFQGRVPRFTGTSNTILDIQTGRAVAQRLDDAPALFLRNHGGVIVGKSIREATVLAQLLERACRLQLLAVSTGVRFHVSSSGDVAGKRDYIYSDTAIRTYWEHCVRTVHQLWKETQQW